MPLHNALAIPGISGAALVLASIAGPAVWRILSQDRSLLYALCPPLGRKVDARKLREGWAEATQKAFAAQLKSLIRQEELLVQKLLKAAPARRALISRDLEFIEARRREVTIKFAALKDVAADTTKDGTTAPGEMPKEISGHWMDRFQQLVRKRNEEWREALLKDALVREAREPGCISPRALWLLGVLEVRKFEYFAALLDIATSIDGTPIVPGENLYYDTRLMPGLEAMGETVEETPLALFDTGLVQPHDAGRTINIGKPAKAEYDGKRVEVTAIGVPGHVSGILFTSLGCTIASLYKAKPNAFGHEHFDAWVKSCTAPRYSVRKL